ncbi:MAG: hypothetical protein ACKPAE_18280 [Microcystis panniformis]
MQTQPLESNTTNLIKLRSSQPESLKSMIKIDLNHRLQDLESGLQKTQTRLKQLETQYQWSTEQFISFFTNDQLQHSEDFDEWLGESWMLDKIQQKIAIIKEIEFVD